MTNYRGRKTTYLVCITIPPSSWREKFSWKKRSQNTPTLKHMKILSSLGFKLTYESESTRIKTQELRSWAYRKNSFLQIKISPSTNKKKTRFFPDTSVKHLETKSRSILWSVAKLYGKVTRVISYRQSKLLLTVPIFQYNHIWDTG